jgi:hypothetical protein
MSTSYREKIKEVTDRIVAVLQTLKNADEALNDTNRPVVLITKGWPVAKLVPQEQLPAVFVHYDGGPIADVNTGLLYVQHRFCISIIDNQLPYGLAYDTVVGYVGELLYFIFGLSRTWELAGQPDLGITNTSPDTVEVRADNDVMNQSLVQADIRFIIERNLSLYEEV